MRAAGPLVGVALLCQGCATGAPAAHVAGAPRLLLADVDADPLGLGGNPGALFELDPLAGTARLVCSSREFTDPVDVIGEPDGSLLVLDLRGLGSDGRLWRIARDGSRVERAAPGAPLVDPTAIARDPDGSLWICDRGAEFAGAAGPGALFHLSADLARCERVWSGPPFAAPADLGFVDGRLFVLDADAFRRDIADRSEGALFRVEPGGPDASVRASLIRVAELHLVSPLSFAPWRDGSFLIADANADPRDEGTRRRLTGAIWQLDAKGHVAPFAQDESWIDPCGVTLVRRAGSSSVEDVELLVVDGSSDPLKLGNDPVGVGFGGTGRGGVDAVDLATRAVRRCVASPVFVNPARLRVVP